MTHTNLLREILHVYESIPLIEENMDIKYRLLNTAHEAEQLIADYEAIKSKPQWVRIVWDMIMFVSTAIVIAAYIQRSGQSPGRSAKDSPVWAWTAVKELQRLFMLDRQDSGVPYKSDLNFQELVFRRTQHEVELDQHE